MARNQMEVIKMRIPGISRWIVVVALVVALATGCVLWLDRSFNPQSVAMRCERKIQEKVDPIALQSWATNLLQQYAPERTNYAGPFVAPVSLQSIWHRSGPSVYIRGGYHDEAPYVFISWGAAGGHWGLSVGSPTFVPANPSDGTRKWREGIYFWEQLH